MLLANAGPYLKMLFKGGGCKAYILLIKRVLLLAFCYSSAASCFSLIHGLHRITKFADGNGKIVETLPHPLVEMVLNQCLKTE